MENDRTTCFFAGDINISEKIDSTYIENDLKEFIINHDLRIANWEGPIVNDELTPINKAGPHIKQHPTFEILLSEKLFNYFSLANNHIMDFGKQGLELTKKKLFDFGIIGFGAGQEMEEIYKPLVVSKNNIKIAFFAAGENQFGCKKSSDSNYGYAWIFSQQLYRNIIEIKSKVDVVILMAHSGLEMFNLPLPEWREQYKFLIDLGVDLIVGSHPHVIQPMEIYNGKQIYYSLGNFIFNTKEYVNSSDWNLSMGLSCEIIKSDKVSIEISEYYFRFDEKLHFEDGPINNKNELFNDPLYKDMVDKICLSSWNNYYESYYLYTDNKFDFDERFINLPHFAQCFLKKIFLRYLKYKTNNQILLYHNISIETHRFAVERALRILNEIE